MMLRATWFAAVLLGAACGLLGAAEAKPEGLVFGDDPRKPTEMTPELKCHACHATVQETEKKLARTKRTESDIYDATQGVCDMQSFRTYKFIPPEMVKGCNAFVDEVEDFEEELYKGGDVEDRLCSSFCKGVDYKSMEQERAERAAEEEANPKSKKSKKKGKKKKGKKNKKNKKQKSGKKSKKSARKDGTEGTEL